MRNLTELDPYRVELAPEIWRKMGTAVDYNRKRVGAFIVRHNEIDLRIIASGGGGWDHVSVSTENRCPTWEEMELIAKLFFNDDEVAMQLHVPKTDHINNHPYTLHWWRPRVNQKIPLPPKHYV